MRRSPRRSRRYLNIRICPHHRRSLHVHRSRPRRGRFCRGRRNRHRRRRRGRWRRIQSIRVNRTVPISSCHRPGHRLATAVIHHRCKLLLGRRNGPRITRLIRINIRHQRTHRHRNQRGHLSATTTDSSAPSHNQNPGKSQAAAQHHPSPVAFSARRASQNNTRHRNRHQPDPPRSIFSILARSQSCKTAPCLCSSLPIRSFTSAIRPRRRNRHRHRGRPRSRRNRRRIEPATPSAPASSRKQNSLRR